MSTVQRLLYEAIKSGKVAAVKNLLDRGIDPNLESDSGFLPLFLASEAGNMKMVKLLLKAGADPEMRSSRSWPSPLEIAKQNGHPSVVTLLQHNIDERRQAGQLIDAITTGNAEELKTRIAQGADVNVVFAERNVTLLCLAVSTRNLEIVRILIEAGADINGKTRNSAYLPPLHMASSNIDIEMCKLLIDAGADICSLDYHGNTPLHSAAQTNSRDLAEVFLEACADVHKANNSRRSIFVKLFKPSQDEHYAIVEMLVAKGANADNFGCFFGKHQWEGCKCPDCGSVRDEAHEYDHCKCVRCGASRNDMHDWDNVFRCRICGMSTPDWMRDIARILTELPITSITTEESTSISQRDLMTALNWVADHVKGKYQLFDASPESFSIDRVLDAQYNHYSCEVGSELHLYWRSHFSEDEITVKKHGDDAYSIRRYIYRESDDDGGHGWYI